MKTKKCTKCGEVKDLDKFGNRIKCKDGHRNQCKACISLYRKEYHRCYYKEHKIHISAKRKEYRKTHKEELLVKHKEYRATHKIEISAYHRTYRNTHKIELQEYSESHKLERRKYQKNQHKKCPWRRTFNDIKYRCNNPNSSDYNYYGGRGIQCLITEEELEQIWHRDNAHLLKKPSIDRINNDGNYEYGNCRFIEHIENIVKDKRKPILKYTLDEKFICGFISMSDASRKTGISTSAICACALGQQKTAGGFKWKYKEQE